MILDDAGIEQAVADTLAAWAPAYIRLMESQTGRTPGLLPAPQVPMVVNDTDAPIGPHTGNPTFLVVSAGFDSEPETFEADTRVAALLMTFQVTVGSTDFGPTHQLTRLYTQALSKALMEHPPAHEQVMGLEWVDAVYESPQDRERTMMFGQGVFRLFVFDSATSLSMAAGPPTAPDPGPAWSTVDEVDVTVTPVADLP